MTSRVYRRQRRRNTADREEERPRPRLLGNSQPFHSHGGRPAEDFAAAKTPSVRISTSKPFPPAPMAIIERDVMVLAAKAIR